MKHRSIKLKAKFTTTAKKNVELFFTQILLPFFTQQQHTTLVKIMNSLGEKKMFQKIN